MATIPRHLTAVPSPATRRPSESERAARTIRLYDTARLGIAGALAPGEVVARLGDELGSALWVCPNDSRTSAFPPHDAPPHGLSEPLAVALAAGGGALGSLVRLPLPSGEALAVNVELRRGTSLIAIPRGEVPTFALLQHAATLAGLQLERLWACSADHRRRGAEPLGRLLDGTAVSLEPWGIADGPLVVVALAEGTWEGINWMHDALAERRLANLIATRGQIVYALLPGTEAALAQLPEIFAGAAVGVSRAFTDAQLITTGASQARAALETAASRSHGLVRFEELRPSFLPRSTAEAHAAVEKVLGPVIRYDEQHGTELVRSLAAFLQCDRSWQRTAETLGVHKQTLVYRMRRIDELTGRRLRQTEVLAESWLALKAHGVLDG